MWVKSTLLILLVLGGSVCASPSHEPHEGYWEVTKPSTGGIGSAVELRGDGTYVFVTTVMVDVHYSLSASTLTLYDPKEGEASKHSIPVHIENGMFVVDQGTSNEVRKERMGVQTSGTSPIVGVWKYRHYTGAEAYERYTADGHLQLRIPMREELGHYSVVNGKITLEAGRPGSAMTFDLENGELVTHDNQNGSTIHYRHMQEGRWYGPVDYLRRAP